MAGLALMGGIAKAAGILGVVASVGSAVAGVKAAKTDATEQNAQYRYEKKVAEQEADASRASGQRAAASRYREGREIASRQRAIAAASGGGGDQSVITMMNNTDAEVDLAARTEMFNAENQARGFDNQATVSGINAKNALKGGTLSAVGAGIRGVSGVANSVSSMYDRFGRINKKTSSSVGRYG